MSRRQSGRVCRRPKAFSTRSRSREVAGGPARFPAWGVSRGRLRRSARRRPRGPSFKGDPDILELPEHSKGLGQPVAARGYGLPSQFEKNLQRRESPGLTRVAAVVGVVRAAAGPVRHHHAQRPALRAPPPGLVGHRPAQASPDGDGAW